jgi:hypothetical protein
MTPWRLDSKLKATMTAALSACKLTSLIATCYDLRLALKFGQQQIGRHEAGPDSPAAFFTSP